MILLVFMFLLILEKLLSVRPDLGARPRANMLLYGSPVTSVKLDTLQEELVFLLVPTAFSLFGLWLAWVWLGEGTDLFGNLCRIPLKRLLNCSLSALH